MSDFRLRILLWWSAVGLNVIPLCSMLPEASQFFSTEIVRNQTQDEHLDYNKINNQSYTTLFTDIHKTCMSENYTYQACYCHNNNGKSVEGKIFE